MKLSRELTSDGKPHVIFVYAGGHGATDGEKLQQLFLLNSNDPKNATFHLEYKLRYLVGDPLSLARMFAVFDCCRVPVKNLAGLVGNGRGVNQGGDFGAWKNRKTILTSTSTSKLADQAVLLLQMGDLQKD